MSIEQDEHRQSQESQSEQRGRNWKHFPQHEQVGPEAVLFDARWGQTPAERKRYLLQAEWQSQLVPGLLIIP